MKNELHLLDRLSYRVARALGFRSVEAKLSDGSLIHALHHHAPDAHLPPIVFLHGISNNATAFLKLMKRLRGKCREIISIDIPGHGKSPAPLEGMRAKHIRPKLKEGFDLLVKEKSLLVGNSLGGLAAVRLAHDSPEKILAVSLISPGGAGVPEESFRAFLKSFQMNTRSEAKEFLRRIFHRLPHATPIIAPYARYNFHRPAIQELLSGIVMTDLMSAEELRKLQIPIQLIWGKNDTLQPKEQRDFYFEHLKHAKETHEPEGFSHCPQFERANELQELLTSFLSKV